MPSLRELKELAAQKGVELPGAAEDEEGSTPAESQAEPEERVDYEVAKPSAELDFVEEDLEDEGGAVADEEDDWEPPEIVERES